MNPSYNQALRICTAVRVRPPAQYEDHFFDTFPQMCPYIRCGNAGAMAVNADFMFGSMVCQESIFEDAGKHLMTRFLRADENITFITFGSPKSGKTFTLFGPGVQFTDSAAMYGLFPRLATYLFGHYPAQLFYTSEIDISVAVSFIEIDTHNNETRNLLNQTGDLSDSQYKYCCSAREMINCLHTAFNNRKSEVSHIVAEVILDQPIFADDGGLVQTKSTALFVDIGRSVLERPCYQLGGPQQIVIDEGHYVLSSLVATRGGTINISDKTLEENYLYNILRSSFSGERKTMAFCCLSPNSHSYTINSHSITDLMAIFELSKQLPMAENPVSSLSRNLDMKDMKDNRANCLISEAESLLSRLSLTKSVTEEDNERLNSWLHMKKEIDESLNGQVPGQLECIEEVTESEEEIASSNEKMSESPVSLDNSLSESDQEEGDSKVCQLSNNNFFSSLDNLNVQFNAFVDKFVDSFKTQTNFTPTKERKRDYSAARRGGLPELLPKVQEVQNANECPANSIEGSSMGCIKKTPQVSKTRISTNSIKKPDRIPGSQNRRFNTTKIAKTSCQYNDRRADVYYSDSSEEETLAQNPASKPNEWDIKLDEKPDEKEPFISWPMVDKQYMSDEDVYNWMMECEVELKEVRERWGFCLDRLKHSKSKGREIKAIENERNKLMFHAMSGIYPCIKLMEGYLEDGCTDINEPYDLYSHDIRCYRMYKDDFNKQKNKLDASVKNKTATDCQVRDFIMADEIIETLDSNIEFLSFLMQNNRPPEQKLPNTDVGRAVLERFKSFTSIEMRHLLFKYFMKVVDLRENSSHLESKIKSMEIQMNWYAQRINSLTKTIQQMRTEQSQMQMTKYSPPEGAYGGHSPSPPTLALPEGSRSRRGPQVIPQQNLSKLQVTKSTPPTKVTLTNKKLIIEQSSNSNKH